MVSLLSSITVFTRHHHLLSHTQLTQIYFKIFTRNLFQKFKLITNRHLEFIQVCRAVAIGILLMGFIGYFIKLVHIPINYIIV